MGFAYIAVKSRIRSLVVMAAVFTVLGIANAVILTVIDTGTKENPVTGPAQSFSSAYLMLLWLAMIVAAFFANRRWLMWRAVHPRGSDVWYKGGASQVASQTVQAPLTGTPFAGTAQGTRQWTQPSPPGSDMPVERQTVTSTPSRRVEDVNDIDEPGLVALGLTEQQAAHFVAVRSRVQGFGSVQEVLTSGALHPHSFVSVRDALGEPSSQSLPEPRSGGRILDF
jgi:hypothetical protein